ncbi:3-hydroxyacyl-CoA dehydrogenase NAD-binding domain-containing protein [Cryobacterium sp. Hb1]|uniref:3-hydroxyacyl-CoA dehydrogenase NAD-binding domain-containing protein n=1 Tax=Cryobacterium sp. Hb1 TaxID=1259147 RepID=UPI00106C97A2|nr:hypothetical protein E3T38_07130 [Cryobacterium sp. Hb1]
MTPRTGISRIKTVGVVGSGAMGRGIAESCLRTRRTVPLHDTSAERPEPGSTRTT